MPIFDPAHTATTPFGINEFLRSTEDVKTESYTLAASTVPSQTIDGNPGQKILQPGTVLAKITSGPEKDKVGPFFNGTAGTKEVQTLTGTTVTAGTYAINGIQAPSGLVNTGAIAFDAVAADIQAAIDEVAGAGVVTVGGGPVSTTPVTLTFNLGTGVDVPSVTVDQTSLTGTIAVTETTKGAGGPTDGRTDLANIVGICKTAAPWQLTVGDLEVSVAYEASVKQGWCIEYTTAKPTGDVLSNTTAAAMRPDGAAKLNGVAILFKS